jgi:predicted ArsR family transcriptional regulator
MSTYPDTPGFKTGGTSEEAAAVASSYAGELRDDVLAVLTLVGPKTADEVAEALDVTRMAVRPRLSELRLQGLIRDSGQRRVNASGKPAIVWEPGSEVREAPEPRRAFTASEWDLAMLDVLRSWGPHTADEVAEFLGLDFLYVRPSISLLRGSGLVRATSERRLNKSGRRAIVWEVA